MRVKNVRAPTRNGSGDVMPVEGEVNGEPMLMPEPEDPTERAAPARAT